MFLLGGSNSRRMSPFTEPLYRPKMHHLNKHYGLFMLPHQDGWFWIQTRAWPVLAIFKEEKSQDSPSSLGNDSKWLLVFSHGESLNKIDYKCIILKVFLQCSMSQKPRFMYISHTPTHTTLNFKPEICFKFTWQKQLQTSRVYYLTCLFINYLFEPKVKRKWFTSCHFM